MLFFTSSCNGPETTEKPNVLFINIDDLRDTDYEPQLRTPNLERLAEEGMSFERAYVQGSFCNPSRTSFLTGLRLTTTNVIDNRTPFRDELPDVVSLPQLFRESGYHTYGIGKIFHLPDPYDDPRAWDKVIYPGGNDLGRQGEGRNLTDGKVGWCRWRMAEGTDTDQSDGQIALEAIKFLEQEHEKPFFLAVGFHKPHDPFVAPKKYFDIYPLEKIQLHNDPESKSPTPPEHIQGDHPWKLAFDQFDAQDKKEFQRAYYAGASFTDAQIGKVLDKLKETRYSDNTIIILLSDHGYHLGERGWWNKATLYEYTARSPLIVCTPDMKARGKECYQLVEFVDIYPTLLDLCRLESPPHELAGQSFKPLLDDPEQAWKKSAYTENLNRPGRTGRTIRTGNWRYIEWRSKENDEIISQELFDHQKDPDEYDNLADSPEYASVLNRLKDSLNVFISLERSRCRELHEE